MPHRIWKHDCRVLGGMRVQGGPVCYACGAEGEYDGWGLTGIEAMGRYVGRTGLKPMGPHTQYAHERLKGSTQQCDVCGGRGLIDVNLGESYLNCKTCFGTGSVLSWSRETFDAVRNEILERYTDAPNAGCPWVDEVDA